MFHHLLLRHVYSFGLLKFVMFRHVLFSGMFNHLLLRHVYSFGLYNFHAHCRPGTCFLLRGRCVSGCTTGRAGLLLSSADVETASSFGMFILSACISLSCFGLFYFPACLLTTFFFGMFLLSACLLVSCFGMFYFLTTFFFRMFLLSACLLVSCLGMFYFPVCLTTFFCVLSSAEQRWRGNSVKLSHVYSFGLFIVKVIQ